MVPQALYLFGRIESGQTPVVWPGFKKKVVNGFFKGRVKDFYTAFAHPIIRDAFADARMAELIAGAQSEASAAANALL